jgi:hypothetical protein
MCYPIFYLEGIRALAKSPWELNTNRFTSVCIVWESPLKRETDEKSGRFPMKFLKKTDIVLRMIR